MEKLKELVDEQEREIERAVIKRVKNEYRLKPALSYLEVHVNEYDWFQMTKEQRRVHLKKVLERL